MTENDPEFYDDDDQLDLEEPLDGRDGQPVTEGSSDEPETLDSNDPLRDTDAILTATTDPSTMTAEAVEATEDEEIDEEYILDDEEIEEFELDQEFLDTEFEDEQF